MRQLRAAGIAAMVALLLAIWSAAPLAGDAAPAGGRVVVIGDIHGAIDQFRGILQTAGLTDDVQKWSAGNTTFVQTGDFTDRGAGVRAVMDLLMALEGQATSAGGRVQIVFGNHEGMNLIGETKDVTPEIFASFAGPDAEARREEAWKTYEKFQATRASRLGTAPAALTRDAWMTAHPPGFLEYRDAIGPDGRYGKWLRRLPAAAQIGDSIFLHGGIHPDAPPDSIEDLNKQVAREIRTFDEYRKHLVDRDVILPFFTLRETLDAIEAEAKAITAAQAAAKNGEQPPILATLDRRHLEVLNAIGRLGTWALINPNGPLWYRGYATLPSPERAPDIDKLLKKYRARRFVVGHTVLTSMRITPRFDRRIFLIDTGMLSTHYKGGRASALEIDGPRVTAIYQDGRVMLDPETAQPD
jgi:hypothetical protein